MSVTYVPPKVLYLKRLQLLYDVRLSRLKRPGCTNIPINFLEGFRK